MDSTSTWSQVSTYPCFVYFTLCLNGATNDIHLSKLPLKQYPFRELWLYCKFWSITDSFLTIIILLSEWVSEEFLKGTFGNSYVAMSSHVRGSANNTVLLTLTLKLLWGPSCNLSGTHTMCERIATKCDTCSLHCKSLLWVSFRRVDSAVFLVAFFCAWSMHLIAI